MAKQYDEGEVGCEKASIEKQSPLAKALSDMGSTMDLIKDSIDSLERRLAPVMASLPTPPDTAKLEKDPEATSPTVNTLETFIRQINDRNSDIHSLMGRLEV